MRGRKPTPTHLKLVKGNPGKRQIAQAEPERLPTKLACADWLAAIPYAKAVWDRITDELAWALSHPSSVTRKSLANGRLGIRYQASLISTRICGNDFCEKAVSAALRKPLLGTSLLETQRGNISRLALFRRPDRSVVSQ